MIYVIAHTRQAFETFQPRQRRTTRHARQFRTREAPLFPRYLFVAFDSGRLLVA